MIKVSILYPSGEGKRFDMAYYCDKHIAMVKEKLGAACKRVDVDLGLGGKQPGSIPPYVAMAHLCFDSIEAFQAAFGPNNAAFRADLPNYTDIEPNIQISEMKM